MNIENPIHPHLVEAYETMDRHSTMPLWEVYHKLVSFAPTSFGVPYIWRYADLRPLLMDAGQRITAEEAERRVLALKNPGLERPGIAQTLFAGLQLVLPGEIAAAHRHTQGAIRFVLESTGGYTAVEGERCSMQRGDFITTPNWCWHDHENTGDGPMIWLDGLDIPLVNFFGAKFAEENEVDQQPIHRADNDSEPRFGRGMRPFAGAEQKPYSPIFRYPYGPSRDALMHIAAGDEIDPGHGFKMVYANPNDGGHALPTIAAFLQYLPAGFETVAVRSTESTIFCVSEGRGTARIGETEFAFEENDTFVAPNWSHIQLKADTNAILFSFSDRAAQERLGIFRQDA
ncbi:MAG: cupin domain-containing protein [Pseudomonadota bacterium]